MQDPTIINEATRVSGQFWGFIVSFVALCVASFRIFKWIIKPVTAKQGEIEVSIKNIDAKAEANKTAIVKQEVEIKMLKKEMESVREENKVIVDRVEKLLDKFEERLDGKYESFEKLFETKLKALENNNS